MDRKQIVLSENWRFYREEGKEKAHTAEGAENAAPQEEGYPYPGVSAAWYKGYDDSGWREVTLPHDWSVELPFSRQYSSGTGYLAGGIGWYRVHFRLPEEYRGKSVRVVFDGVYKNSQVWCNSYYLGRRPYGYSTFSYDITYAAAFGETENVLCVKVVHTDLADSRWFTGSGITRKVTVVVEEPVHPAEYGVFFRAEQVEADEKDLERRSGRARIAITHRVEAAETLPCQGTCVGQPGKENAGRGTSTGDTGQSSGRTEELLVRIRTELENAEGETVLALEGQAPAGGECTLSGVLEQAKLWSPEHPYLYHMRTWYALPGEGQEAYLADETAVGIRQIEFHPEKGFLINGVETKLKGVCVHHDGGVLGAAMKTEIWQRRLTALKECGCNAIRCSHNPHMPELYELCDRMGFFVMDEAFDEWENAKNKWSRGHNVYPPVHEGYFEEFPRWHEADLQAMVRRDRNHPSVILWSIGNEIDYPNDPYCHPSFDSMTGNNDANKPAAERRYDADKPNALRLVSIAAKLEKIVRGEDSTRPVTLAAAFPELSAETGLFQGLDVVGYNYKEHLYERDHKRFPDKPFLGSENGHSYGAWLAVKENAYISGQFLWTGIDYLGEAGGWPVHGSPAGILTCAGDKKPEFYRRKSFWCQEPVLALAARRSADGPESWRPMECCWNYREGEEILVKIFSNLPRVRLLLDGEEIGCLTGYNGDGAYCFQVRYRPGVLTAEGYGKPFGFVGAGTFEAAADADGSLSVSAGAGISEAAADAGEEPAAVCSLAPTGQAVGLDCQVWRQADALTGRAWEEVSGEPGYLYQLEIQLLDAQGSPVSWQERILSVEVDGAGESAGLENGNLADVTPYSADSRSTFRGRLLAFVRRRKPGEIRVKLSMEGFGTTVHLGS